VLYCRVVPSRWAVLELAGVEVSSPTTLQLAPSRVFTVDWQRVSYGTDDGAAEPL